MLYDLFWWVLVPLVGVLLAATLMARCAPDPSRWIAWPTDLPRPEVGDQVQQSDGAWYVNRFRWNPERRSLEVQVTRPYDPRRDRKRRAVAWADRWRG